MIWDRGYTSSYYMTLVDPSSWRDMARVEITGGNISRVSTGLLASGTISATDWDRGETWVRVYLDAQQNASSEHIPLITGLTSVPEKNVNGVLQTYDIQIYSVLKPLEDMLLPRGWYAVAGSDGAKVISELLSVTPAPVIVSGESPRLSESIIAEENETYLSMVEKILLAINWRIRLQGDGTIELTSKATTASFNLDPVNADYIEPDITIERDWYTCPNVFIATSGDASGIARDEDVNSPLSIPSRGREIWKSETAADINTGETIAEYAARRLKEEQQIATTARYSRRFIPDLYPSDVVFLRYPEQSLQGMYRIDSQSVVLGYAARTTEEVLKLG